MRQTRRSPSPGFAHTQRTLEFGDVAVYTGAEISQFIEGFHLYAHLMVVQSAALIEHRPVSAFFATLLDICPTGISTVSHRFLRHTSIVFLARILYWLTTISERVARYLERQGWLARDEQSDHLTLPLEEGDHGNGQHGRIGGLSLHAGVAVNTRERKKLERICRYISRPALSEVRLELTDQGMVRYALKSAYRDGTTGRQSDTLCSSGAAFRHWILWPNWQRWC